MLAASRPCRFGSTINRSVDGVMTEFTNLAEVFRHQPGPGTAGLPAVGVILRASVRVPFGRPNGKRPPTICERPFRVYLCRYRDAAIDG